MWSILNPDSFPIIFPARNHKKFSSLEEFTIYFKEKLLTMPKAYNNYIFSFNEFCEEIDKYWFVYKTNAYLRRNLIRVHLDKEYLHPFYMIYKENIIKYWKDKTNELKKEYQERLKDIDEFSNDLESYEKFHTLPPNIYNYFSDIFYKRIKF